MGLGLLRLPFTSYFLRPAWGAALSVLGAQKTALYVRHDQGDTGHQPLGECQGRQLAPRQLGTWQDTQASGPAGAVHVGPSGASGTPLAIKAASVGLVGV